MARCVHCKTGINPESPSTYDGGGRDLNPLTLRMAWQHYYCRQLHEDSIMLMPPPKSYQKSYQTQYERYIKALQ